MVILFLDNKSKMTDILSYIISSSFTSVILLYLVPTAAFKSNPPNYRPVAEGGRINSSLAGSHQGSCLGLYNSHTYIHET